MSSAAREVALFGMLGALTFGAKVVMMGLPNIEPVSLLVMLFAVTFGKKALFPIYVYVLLELVLFGIGLWSAAYIYIWALLALAAWLLRDMRSPLGCAFRHIWPAVWRPVYPRLPAHRRPCFRPELVAQWTPL